jgi:hypothetical protein
MSMSQLRIGPRATAVSVGHEALKSGGPRADAPPMTHVPLLLLVPVFALVAWAEWRPRRVVGQVLVGVAALFAFFGVQDPGVSAQELVDTASPAVAILVSVGRAAGLAAVLAAVAFALRERAAGLGD